jgi:hypothetical protein
VNELRGSAAGSVEATPPATLALLALLAQLREYV